ncbi:MAG: 50S ribosomal protein L6 [Deltaproteobacteria bacterium]|nr:MAG: 50S ribosomal protein L6 [Deltaproteobacteria bacterium]
MSRIGKLPIELPKGVTFEVADGVMRAKGPKGQLSKATHPRVSFEIDGNVVRVTRADDSRESRSVHGLMRALAANLVKGVSEGFERRLEINGVGYRAEVKGRQLVLQLGYSHPIEYDLPDGVDAKVDKNIVVLSGADKELLGKTAAKVRSFRPPEPYKGKGIKYVEETIQRKVGKAGAA